MTPSRILLALHRPEAPADLARPLDDLGLEVEVSRDPEQTLRLARSGTFDLVLLDPADRSPAGPELRGLLELADAPDGPGLVVFTETPESLGEGREFLDDYLPPDVAPEHAADRLRFTIERRRADADRRAQLHELQRATITDFKTGLFNDRHFAERCREESSRAKRHSHPVGLLLIDLDDFKCINDTHGHDFGDFVLLAVARNLRSVVRDFDVPARIGGDEFALLLPGTNLAHAVAIAERVRSTLDQLEFSHNGRSARCTVSIGVGCFDPDTDHDFDRSLFDVDQALLHAKREGRNRLTVAAGRSAPSRREPRPPRDADDASDDDSSPAGAATRALGSISASAPSPPRS